MKKLLMLLALGLLVACDYTVPLVTTPTIAIDKSVVGLWQNTDTNKPTQLLVLPLSENEYMVSYPANTADGVFARACLCRVGDKTLVQLKWFGTAEGKLPDDKSVFQFISYTATSNKLTMQLLNTDVVNKDVASTDELAKAIIANKDKTNLFSEKAVFTRVTD